MLYFHIDLLFALCRFLSGQTIHPEYVCASIPGECAPLKPPVDRWQSLPTTSTDPRSPPEFPITARPPVQSSRFSPADVHPAPGRRRYPLLCLALHGRARPRHAPPSLAQPRCARPRQIQVVIDLRSSVVHLPITSSPRLPLFATPAPVPKPPSKPG